jgi:uncharacterized protein YwbE
MKENLNAEPDKRRHMRIGKNTYIVSECFQPTGKTAKEIIEKLILSKSKKTA